MACTAIAVPAPTLKRLQGMGRRLAVTDMRFDRSLASARAAIGEIATREMPPTQPCSAAWLNKWLCHIGYPREGVKDVFAASLAAWWEGAESALPAPAQALAELSDSELQAISDVYGDLKVATCLSQHPGAWKGQSVQRQPRRHLYFVRPLSVTAWDNKISGHVGCDRSTDGFLLHLEACREWG